MSKPDKLQPRPPANGAPPERPASAHLWETVRYRDGDLGSGADIAKAKLRREAAQHGLRVQTFDIGPAIVTGVKLEQVDTDKQGNAVMAERRACELTIVACTQPAGPQRWVRMTSASGPAAVEVLVTEGDKVVRRDEYHQEDARQIALGFAERALEECAGP